MQEIKFVYAFEELGIKDKNLAGSKAVNLAVMKNLGLNVPDGFVVSTEACLDFNKNKNKLSESAIEQIWKNLEELENKSGQKFGSKTNPLLVSVRSGARVSMPGMMNSLLNIGINDTIAEGLATKFKSEWFAYDTYRRFIQTYSEIVAKVEKAGFEKLIEDVKNKKKIKNDFEISVEDLKILIEKFKAIYKKATKSEFPQDVKLQLLNAVGAVFESWDNNRAVLYRRLHNIPQEWGTASIVQRMVYGNLNEKSASGVLFSRNPSTGERVLYGEYLNKAQGVDVVDGVRTPHQIIDMKEENPQVYNEIVENMEKLEEYYKDMQDVEFTIEDGKLFMLQTRNGKRTAQAALKIAVSLVREGKIDEKQAIMMLDAKQLDTLLHPQFDAKTLQKIEPLASGLPASPGAASGKIVFDSEMAKMLKDKKEKVILIRAETSPEDIVGLVSAEGILTQRGGMTSHAAVVARGMGKCCVTGCSNLYIDEVNYTVKIGEKTFKEGDIISLDGFTGKVYEGEIKAFPATLPSEYHTLMSWVDENRVMQVRANVDTAEDALMAYNFGAEGIGLVRTEHMFFETERLKSMVEMILATDKDERNRALMKIMPFQKQDFIGIYKKMKGYPVTIRLLDPPLHEFLPKTDEEIDIIAKQLTVSVNTLKRTLESLKEFNPMMGHRGLRLDITYPEIAQMQTRAIIESAIQVNQEYGFNIIVEIMIPLSADAKEYAYVHEIVQKEADEIIKQKGISLKYKIGTMVELPRACLIADELAKHTEFFSFGTNDLTQMTFGFSRDDAGKFLPDYYSKKIFDFDPFATIDKVGVGTLINMAIEKAKQTNPDLKAGICGEHGGDPLSIEFFHNSGLSYVSCSPYRVPIARLAAAQANIKNPRSCPLGV